jgi:hypothetical protein
MDNAFVQVQRVAGHPTITGFAYIDPANPAALSHYRAREDRLTFQMTAAQAASAIATGGFEVAADSKSEAEGEAVIDEKTTEETP